MPFLNRIESHFESSKGRLTFLFRKSIVNYIVGEMLFHWKNFRRIPSSRSMSLFLQYPKLEDSNQPDLTHGHKYISTIKTLKMFSLLIGCLAVQAYLSFGITNGFSGS